MKDFREFKEAYQNQIDQIDQLDVDIHEFTGAAIRTLEEYSELSDYEIRQFLRQTYMRLDRDE